MPGVLDFLFEGRPPSAVTTYGETVENIPQWLSDYTQGMIGRANVIAAEPYQAYEGPRIAGFSPDQLAGFDVGRSTVGAWQPGMDAAGGAFGTAAGMDVRGAAEPYLGDAATGYTGVGSLSPLGAAAPFMEQGLRGFPGAVEDYMDPYISNVLDRQAELSQRQLTEQFLPSLQDAFVGSGSFGGDRMMELGIRGTRDIAEGLQGQQLGALSQAYGKAGDLYGADASRYMQGAAMAGDLTTAGGQLGLGGARGLYDVGMGYGTLAGMEGELALGAGEGFGALAEATSGMGWRDAAGLETIGAQERGLGQQSLDLAYGDFLEQRGYPQSQIDWMSSVIRGLPSQGGTTTTTETGPADIYGPSPLAQIGSAYSIYKGIGE